MSKIRIKHDDDNNRDEMKDESPNRTPAPENPARYERDSQNESRNRSAELDDDPIELTEEAAGLVEQLERERDDALAARKRALADFVNFQKRAKENETRARKEGVVSVVRSLLPVIDHFDLALSQDTDTLSVEQLLGGVKIVKAELVKALESHGVTAIIPDPGDDFDPNRHEAMMRRKSNRILPGRIVSVLQPGFAVGNLVLRPAKVTVAAGEDDESDD